MADKKVFDASTTDDEIAVATKQQESEQGEKLIGVYKPKVVTNSFVKPTIQNGETK